VLACLLAAAPLAAPAADSHVVPAELWDRPRSGAIVLQQPALRQAVQAHLAQPGSRLLIRYAGARETALLQAEELRAWLVALAVEPAAVALRGDLQPGQPLTIEIAP
jgi:hypothetical protein